MAEKFIQIFIKHIYLKIENEDIYKRREQGTGNREQVTGNREQGTGNR
jgi:hypothetical protein